LANWQTIGKLADQRGLDTCVKHETSQQAEAVTVPSSAIA